MSTLSLALPEELVEAIAQRVLAALAEQGMTGRELSRSPYATTDEAAEILRCSRQRIHDLLTQGKLSRLKEGRRTLVLRSELDALVQLDRRRRTL